MFAIIGIALIAYQPIMNYVIGPMQLAKSYENNLSAQTLKENRERFENLNPETGESEADNNPETDYLFDFDSVTNITSLIPNPEINTENVVGGIYVPSVNMTMPIMYGVSQDTLLTSAGTMKRTQKMGEGNYALIGHNSKNQDALFAPIRRIEQGDSMYITDKHSVYEYKMTVKEVVQPSDIHVIHDVEDSTLLTLLSCTEDGTERVLIQGELVDVFYYESADEDILKALNKL